MSFLNLMASIVGLRPAAPTIPVTTVSAVLTVAASRIPSSPNTISGMSAHPAAIKRSFNCAAASAVAMEATFGLYFRTCLANSSTFVPADSASMTKLSGQASTISSVCVPMDPVDPRRLRRLVKFSQPSRDFCSVSFREAALPTGAEGSIHPSPVPLEPGAALSARTNFGGAGVTTTYAEVTLARARMAANCILILLLWR